MGSIKVPGKMNAKNLLMIVGKAGWVPIESCSLPLRRISFHSAYLHSQLCLHFKQKRRLRVLATVWFILARLTDKTIVVGGLRGWWEADYQDTLSNFMTLGSWSIWIRELLSQSSDYIIVQYYEIGGMTDSRGTVNVSRFKNYKKVVGKTQWPCLWPRIWHIF